MWSWSLRTGTLLLLLALGDVLHAQTTIFQQGFENAALTCTENWGYTGGTRNSTTARAGGTQSCRLGRTGETNVLTFNTVNLAGMTGPQLSLYHSVLTGAGPGMDTREGVVIQVQLNGGAWTTIGRMTGFSDNNWAWTAPLGGTTMVSTGCTGYTCPNPLVYSVPAGTNTLALRFTTVGNNASSCATFNTNFGVPNPSFFDLATEGFYVDDVRLTTTATTIPSIWTGAASTDWFDCANWHDRIVPDATIDAVIDQTASNSCTVGTLTTLGTAAFCKNLSLSSSTATNRLLLIDNGRSLNVANALTITKSAGSGVLSMQVLNGTLVCGSLTVDGYTTGAGHALFRNRPAANSVTVNGDLRIETGGQVDLDPGVSPGGNILLAGNWVNNDSEAAFKESNSSVAFIGTTPQSISTASFEEKFGDLLMSITGNDLTLNAPVLVRDVLSWSTNSRVISGGANLLTMDAGSVASGYGNMRFVSGPVKKIGNTDFTFPIGKGTACRPAQVTGITNATSAYTAQYFAASPQSTFGTARESSLHHTSDCEYWNISRSAGTDDVYLWLSWNTPNSCGVTLLSDMRTAYWNGSQWLNRGTGGTTGNTTTGTVRTEDLQSVFGIFTLASASAQNPLPIQLLAFDARADRDQVICTWTTATERDNDHFTVERAADAIRFEPIGTVPGAGDSQELRDYSFVDAWPLSGVSYYRLRQTDYDGTTTVTDAVPVLMRGTHDLVVTANGIVQHDLALGSTYQVLDPGGRAVAQGVANTQTFQLPVSGLAKGVYIVRLTDGLHVRTARFVP